MNSNDALWHAADAVMEVIGELFPDGLAEREREAIRYDIAYRLAWAIGGLQIYFPNHDALDAPAIEEAIVREFNGRNTDELALRYGLSEVAVYRILRRNRERKASKRP